MNVAGQVQIQWPNFGLRSAGGSAYCQSVYTIADLNCQLQYVFETEDSTSNGILDDPDFDAENVAIVNYSFYKLNNCWKAGGHVEWLKTNSMTGDSTSYYELTDGLNYYATANLVVRPEIHHDWSPTDFAGDYDRAIFGIDAVLTFSVTAKMDDSGPVEPSNFGSWGRFDSFSPGICRNSLSEWAHPGSNEAQASRLRALAA